MNVSIFTPTHKLDHIFELYETIKNQDFYEWIIVANGEHLKAKSAELGLNWIDSCFPFIVEDPRIKVIWFDGPAYVGALKLFACTHCTGDVYLEVDHDDLLTGDAISEVRSAFEDPEIGFVYSNFANFKDDFQLTERYRSDCGWEYRPFNYRGHELEEVVGFPPHPSTVSRIWYAPNHLRAWRASVYNEIGGHNPGMRVLDDQELMCRTYLATQMQHIDKCLYLYRITGSNTWLEHNQEIQNNVIPLHCMYIQQMAATWAIRNNLLALDLGGRFNGKPGFTSVDLKDANINTNLNYQWPFEDSSVGVIIADDIIEHLKDPLHVMKEAYRVLVDGGLLLISVPSSDGRGAYQDPTHISFWNQNSFWYYTRSTQATYIDTPVKFQDITTETVFYSDWHRSNNIPYVRSHLLCLKGTTKYPGPITI